MRFRGIRREDIEQIEVMEDLAATDVNWREGLLDPQLADYLENHCRALVNEDDVAIVLIGGHNPSPGVLHIWAIYSVLTPRYHIGVTRNLIRLRDYAATLGVRRIEGYTDATWPLAQKHLRQLGFEEEGRMREYFGPGRDCIPMGWVAP